MIIGNEQSVRDRANWLSCLALALDEAQRLTTRLAAWQVHSHEAIVLRIRIVAVRAEIDAIRRDTDDCRARSMRPRHDRVPGPMCRRVGNA